MPESRAVARRSDLRRTGATELHHVREDALMIAGISTNLRTAGSERSRRHAYVDVCSVQKVEEDACEIAVSGD